MNIALSVDASGAPIIDMDPFSVEALSDQVAFNERVRETGPIVWLSAHGTYGCGRYDEVVEILKDWGNFTSARGAGLSDITKPGAWRPAGPIVEVDPPRHTQIRSTLSQIISPRVIKGWKESFESEAERLVEECLSRQTEFDVIPILIEAFVLKVFPAALGVHGDREKLLIVGNHNFNAIGPQNEFFRQTQVAQDAVAAWFEHNQTREAMIPGGFGELIFKAEDEGALPKGTASPMLRTLLRGGTDTTISAIGSTLRLLAEHPDQWELAKNNSTLVRYAFEEAIRLESPIRTFFRMTPPSGVEFAGYRLAPETKVQIFPGAANRDPRKWPNSSQFDVTRKPAGHLAFGWGVHNCIGQMIARMEWECLIAAIIRRVDKIAVVAKPRFRMNNALRTLDNLPLRFTLK